MIFIHGGGYTEGNGYNGIYSGLPLSSVGDVIVVTINYRLSTFGFFTTGMYVKFVNSNKICAPYGQGYLKTLCCMLPIIINIIQAYYC